MPKKYADFLSANLFYALSCYGLIVAGVFTVLFGNVSADAFNVSYAAQLIISEIVVIVAPSLFFIFFPYWKNFRKSLRLNKFNPSVLLIIPIGVVGYFFITGVTAVWMGALTAIGLTPEAGGVSVPAPETPNMLLMSMLAVAIAPAVCEEFLFRGLILPAYERRFSSPAAAILLSGLIFGLMHGQTLAAPGHILLGFVLGYVVVATESLWAGVILHLIQNGMAMLLLYFQEEIAALSEGFVHSAADAMLETGGATELIIGGVVLAVICGAIYFALLFVLHILYKSRNGHGPLSRLKIPVPQPEPTPAHEPVHEPALDSIALPEPFPPQPPLSQIPTAGMRFLTWLPLLLTLPLILLNYLSTFLMMVPGFMEWLGAFSSLPY